MARMCSSVMMIRRNWRWYITVALLCIIIWYSLPLTSVMTCRNPESTTTEPHIIYGNEQNEVQILKKENVEPSPTKINERYLVYVCDDKNKCGGWGDRQRGIVCSFFLSMVWKRTFKIVLTSPCDIRPYYQPTKEYNWIFTEEELKGLQYKTNKTLNYMANCTLLNLNLNESETAEVLYVKANCYSYEKIVKNYTKFLPDFLKNIHYKNRALIFREAWNRLMIPTERLTSQVSKIESSGKINLDAKTSGNELICAHLRIRHCGYFPRPFKGLPLSAVSKIWDFIDDNYHEKSRIFVATDDLDVRKSAISKYGARYIGSYAMVIHPDNMRFNLTLACSSQEAAYVDQLMLSKCNVLIYCRRSGFSIHASYLKIKGGEIYTIQGHTNTSVSLKKRTT
ncbi:hypothetical protein LOTGIDRAFT_167433 [Lottia gigantea]|uniref:Peptide-O-fucosyltransferase n=1 Tax=Lottia gigantea TaxID=225164 RepID=V3ZYX5_LOTGI|nr:hypothetical protein LOTGIDRAFT_167433 [Lottia gigantea]ESO86201.1 hypothetical protein LOTGIDRAFT_167433 [Lottia gigantea]